MQQNNQRKPPKKSDIEFDLDGSDETPSIITNKFNPNPNNELANEIITESSLSDESFEHQD